MAQEQVLKSLIAKIDSRPILFIIKSEHCPACIGFTRYEEQTLIKKINEKLDVQIIYWKNDIHNGMYPFLLKYTQFVPSIILVNRDEIKNAVTKKLETPIKAIKYNGYENTPDEFIASGGMFFENLLRPLTASAIIGWLKDVIAKL